MRENDRYDEIHEEMASGEGMPEAPRILPRLTSSSSNRASSLAASRASRSFRRTGSNTRISGRSRRSPGLGRRWAADAWQKGGIDAAWREQMRREWEQLTSAPIVQKDLRHSEEEIARIFGALNHEHVDPRIALAVELGAEARLGQVRRLRRTDINLSPVGAFGLGRVVVQGSGKKMGVMRDLTPEERAAIDRALEGYLFDLEREFQEGVRTDYFVFQAGRLRYDVPPRRRPRRGAAALMPSVRRARTDLPDKPINKRTLTDMFHALEIVAGVVPVEGRGWYGIRRKATDVYEDYESDERVLNSATGHSSSDTRRKKYQQRNRDLILAKTAVTRRRVRAGAFGHATADGDALEEGS